MKQKTLLWIIGIGIAILVIAGILLWLGFKIAPIQTKIILFVLAIVLVVFLIGSVSKSGLEDDFDMNKDMEIIKKWWYDYTGGEKISHEDGVVTRTYNNLINKNFIGLVFRRIDSYKPVSIIYCVEDKKVWDIRDNVSDQQLNNPFHYFKPVTGIMVPKEKKDKHMVLEIGGKVQNKEEEFENKNQSQ